MKHFVRFHSPDEPDGRPWIVFEVQAAAGRWLLFFHPLAGRRRLSPVPPGWKELRPADFAALLARATPVHSPSLGLSRGVPAPEADPAPAPDLEAEILWEREQRLVAEEQLRIAVALVDELRQELESANAELRSLSEELLEMDKAADAQRQR